MTGFSIATLALVLACPLVFPLPCAAETIDFEGSADGTAISTIGNAIFSSRDGAFVYDLGGNFVHSGSSGNGGGTPDFCNAPLTIDFATAVKDLSFFTGRDENAGLRAQISVWVGGAFAALVGLVGDGNPFTEDFQDLSAYTNVTRIEILNVTDDQGLAHDDFSFTKIASVPLPAMALLLGAALLGLSRAGRRKTQTRGRGDLRETGSTARAGRFLPGQRRCGVVSMIAPRPLQPALECSTTDRSGGPLGSQNCRGCYAGYGRQTHRRYLGPRSVRHRHRHESQALCRTR